MHQHLKNVHMICSRLLR